MTDPRTGRYVAVAAAVLGRAPRSVLLRQNPLHHRTVAVAPLVPPGHRALHLAAALLVAGVAYRVRVAALAVQALAQAGSLQPWRHGLALTWHPAWRDLVLAALAALVALPGLRWLRGSNVLPRWGIALTLVLLTATGMLAATHLRLLFSLHSGLTWPLLRDAWVSGEWRELLEHAHPLDLATVLAWPVAWLALRKVPVRGTAGVAIALGVLSLAGLALPMPTPPQRLDLPPECGLAPLELWAVLTRPLRNAPVVDAVPRVPVRHRPPLQPAQLPVPPVDPAHPATETQANRQPALFLEDPRISEPLLPPPVPQKPRPGKRWNVLWIVMESTGLRYFQGETYRGTLPMPFTHSLADQGWFLAQHRSPSNSSATSIFAQLSGLYPVPSLKMFSVEKGNFVPALFRFLPPEYERFLYTPGKLTYFFPKPFLQHSGLTEMVGFDETVVTKNPGGEGLSKDEPLVVDTFTQRLHRAREPFAAVYYSYLAHWEYTDYGPQWHHFHDPRLIGRYHDNLWLLDHLIQKIYAQLQADGRLERTLIVLAGDHGEAFGQHERNWAHARGSYEENFGTPAILWQPQVFPAHVEDRQTLHIDLLPTVLDALGLPYDPALLQGESLFHERLRRKVAFFWGNEGTVSGTWPDGWKLQWQVQDRRCVAFDLSRDPQERKPLRCPTERLELLQDYRDFQREAVPAYSEAVRQGQPFRGHQQPFPQ